MIVQLDDLNHQPVWLAWRNEDRGNKITKVPYAPRGGPGKSDDASTWGTRNEAENRAQQLVNGMGGGVGGVLGIECGDDVRLGGIDLDTCRSDDGMENWAIEVTVRFCSYTETSPSGTGVKIFFMYRNADLPELQRIMGTLTGRQFKRRMNGNHPPGIEVYLTHRYFAVTGKGIDPDLSALRVVNMDDLLWLLTEAGPEFVGNSRGDEDVRGHGDRPQDLSRSGIAFRLGLRMRRQGKTFDEFVEAVRANPDTAAWCRQKGEPDGGRELHRIWEKVTADISSKSEGVSFDDFYAYMPMHNYIYVPTRAHWPGSSVSARLPPVKLTDADGHPVIDKAGNQVTISASAWFDRNKPVEQMTWAPGLPMIIRDKLMIEGGWVDRTGVACFNLYMPPTIIPGDPTKADKWLDHVHYIFPADAEHVVNWLAHRVQHPEDKINHALVLGGAQGIGKDTLLEPVKYAIGPWNFQEVSPTQILGRFNGFLRAVVLRVNEAHDLGEFDRFQLYDKLKAYTAAPPDVLRVDEKYLREYAISNCCGVIVTTNHKTDGIYLPADDRRHFVVWSDRTKEDTRFQNRYWDDLYRWYAEGGIQHVAAYLLDRDISGFDAKAPPPKTEAFWAIVNANRALEESEMADVIDELENPDSFRIDILAGIAITMGDHDLAAWIRDRKNRRILPHRLEKCGYVPVRNPDASDGLWKVDGKRQVIYAKSSLSLRDQIMAAKEITISRVGQ